MGIKTSFFSRLNLDFVFIVPALCYKTTFISFNQVSIFALSDLLSDNTTQRKKIILVLPFLENFNQQRLQSQVNFPLQPVS
jgi:hypothetical protein